MQNAASYPDLQCLGPGYLCEIQQKWPYRTEQSVTRLTEEPEIQGSLHDPAQTFVGIDRESFSAFSTTPISIDSKRAVLSYRRKYGHLRF